MDPGLSVTLMALVTSGTETVMTGKTVGGVRFRYVPALVPGPGTICLKPVLTEPGGIVMVDGLMPPPPAKVIFGIFKTCTEVFGGGVQPALLVYMYQSSVLIVVVIVSVPCGGVPPGVTANVLAITNSLR